MNSYSVACTGASLVAAPINTGRKSLHVQNQSVSAPLWVQFGRAATQDGYSVLVRPDSDAVWETPACPTEALHVNGPVGVIATIFEQ